MKDYSALIKRINKAVDKANSRNAMSKVHIVNVDDDFTKLTGLIIVLADLTKNALPELPPEEISA